MAPISAKTFPTIKKYLLPIRSASEPAQLFSQLFSFARLRGGYTQRGGKYGNTDEPCGEQPRVVCYGSWFTN
jgi:hypothetical protein